MRNGGKNSLRPLDPSHQPILSTLLQGYGGGNVVRPRSLSLSRGSSFTAGVKYAYDPKTTLRAKVTSSGVVSACAVQNLADKVTVTATGQVSQEWTFLCVFACSVKA